MIEGRYHVKMNSALRAVAGLGWWVLALDTMGVLKNNIVLKMMTKNTRCPRAGSRGGGTRRYRRDFTSRVMILELVEFATEHLKVDYIFWCTQEPFYSETLIPFLQARR